MADLDQLQRLDAEIREAEKRAVRAVAAHLRDAVRDLPSESRLGLVFVQRADELDLWATGGDVPLGANLTLRDLGRELHDLDDDTEGDTDATP